MPHQKTALVAVESAIPQDPRVHRQVDWLRDDGWVVDTLGLGSAPTNGVRDHFEVGGIAPWMLTKLGTALIYGFLTNATKFELLTLRRFPHEVRDRVRRGDYDLIVLNDRHFVPWVASDDFKSLGKRTHTHLDLHEYFVPSLPRDTLWRRATASHYEWARRLFGHAGFATRSTVNDGIARLYASELGIPEPTVIRNSPRYVDQSPSRVDPQEIRLLHHGTARSDRGLKEMIDALQFMDDRFTITFMLVGSDEFITELREYAKTLGDRVRIVPPAPMTGLAAAVNDYDLEVMFYAPLTRNLELALPNKLFEAVQGRLGLVIGQSPMMADIIKQHNNGVIVDGWEAADLAAALNKLSAEDVARFKAASDLAAKVLSAENERDVFLSTVDREGDRE